MLKLVKARVAPSVHTRLVEAAQRSGRSVSAEAAALIELGLSGGVPEPQGEVTGADLRSSILEELLEELDDRESRWRAELADVERQLGGLSRRLDGEPPAEAFPGPGPAPEPEPEPLPPEPGELPLRLATVPAGLGYTPTAEQLHALELFETGRPVQIRAFAGTGKTATLALLAAATEKKGEKKGRYLAFNRSIADEAQSRFPSHVTCTTTHSLAWKAMSRKIPQDQLRATPRPQRLREQLGVQELRAGDAVLGPTQVAGLALRTIRRFCASADAELQAEHVPPVAAAGQQGAQLRVQILDLARRTWARMSDPKDEAIPLGHDGYLKLWCLSKPRMRADFFMLDEAQDTTPVVLELLRSQRGQVVYVGDPHQQIYEWRGAVSAMDRIEGAHVATLSQSWRFGEELAAEASRLLQSLGETVPLRGNPSRRTHIRAHGQTDAVLCRTNAGAVAELIDSLASGQRPAVVGGTRELVDLIQDVQRLRSGGEPRTPELVGFAEWQDVERFSETEEGADLRVLVSLVRLHGEAALLSALRQTVDEPGAGLLLSTAHRSKGREWDRVRIGSDYVRHDEPMAPEEARLFYVAITRARELLVVDPEVLGIYTSGDWAQRRQPRPE